MWPECSFRAEYNSGRDSEVLCRAVSGLDGGSEEDLLAGPPPRLRTQLSRDILTRHAEPASGWVSKALRFGRRHRDLDATRAVLTRLGVVLDLAATDREDGGRRRRISRSSYS